LSDSASSHGSAENGKQALSRAANELGLSISDDQAEQLSEYCRLLWEWNSRLNLTRHTTWDLFVTRDLLDTIQLSEHIPEGRRVLDAGSGGGVPGIVLAILRPDLKVVLCDSVGKKVTALQSIVKSLQLSVDVHAARAEVLLKTLRFDAVTMRAVASLSKVLGWLKPVWGAVGQLLLIKGPNWTSEHEAARLDGSLKQRTLEQVASWTTPGRDGQSVLLRVTKAR
jgi:16S rRNA (guanine527-N7)-methyltransferase